MQKGVCLVLLLLQLGSGPATGGVRLTLPLRPKRERAAQRELPPPALSAEECGEVFEYAQGLAASSQPAIDGLMDKDAELSFCPGTGPLDRILSELETASGVRLDYRGLQTPAKACYEKSSLATILVDLGKRFSLDYEGRGSDRLIVHELLLPKIVTKAPPHYPEEARRAKQQGTVTLSVLICVDGSAAQIRTKGDAAAALVAAAVDSVRRWRYEPALRDGVPTAIWITAGVSFTLS